MPKKVIRIITDCGNRDFCRILFKKLKILPLISQYILSLLTFVVNYRDQFFINSEIHTINIRHISKLLLPLENSGIYQKGVYYSDIKIFNRLPFIIIIGIQPLGQFGQRPELSQATGMAVVCCILGKFSGVVCHCFPPDFLLTITNFPII